MAIWEYVQLMYLSWITLICGICGLIFIAIGLINKSNNNFRVFAFVGFICTIFASYSIWNDEHRKVLFFKKQNGCVALIYHSGERPWVMTPTERPAYGNYAISLQMDMPVELKQAWVELTTISKTSRNGYLERVNAMVPLHLAWPVGATSFEPKDVSDHDFFILAVVSKDGKHLDIFDRDKLPDTVQLRNLVPGYYDITIVIHNSTKSLEPISLNLTWPGDVAGLNITSASKCMDGS